MIRIGHRGAKGHRPENTLSSFEKALEIGVDMVELDVHRCKSGEIVVIHDHKVDRMTNGKGYVKELTLDEIRTLTVEGGEKIPTLEEILNFIDKKRKLTSNSKMKRPLRQPLKFSQDTLPKRVGLPMIFS